MSCTIWKKTITSKTHFYLIIIDNSKNNYKNNTVKHKITTVHSIMTHKYTN